MESIYLETSVISYLVSAPSRDLVVAAHQQVTRDWWTAKRQKYELYISRVVIDEVSRGDATQAQQRLSVIQGIVRLAVDDAVDELAQEFLRQSSLPLSAIADASHIAIAAVYGIDFLVTWNCRHIANPHILKKLTSIAAANGFEMPVVCTPLELLEAEPGI